MDYLSKGSCHLSLIDGVLYIVIWRPVAVIGLRNEVSLNIAEDWYSTYSAVE